MKSIVSLFLTFAMLIGMLPMTAWAAETDAISGLCGENLTWSFDESSGTLTISGTGDMDDYSWSQMYDPTSESSDIWVTDAPWRDYYNAIKSIVIESDVTSIGDGAFRGCSAVTSISLSNDVEALGEYSFMDCDGIIDIVIPENVKTIGEAAFSDCNALESVSILGAASIGNFAFSECANLISVELPDTLTSIGEYGFRGCEALRTVTIPSSVRTIGTFAFVWCESLNEICFEGSAPSMDGTILSGLTCNVSYPSDDETWSEELQKEFDDTITWNGNSSDEGTSGSSHSHSYGDWYETKAPTQEAEGEERRDCIDCDYYETRITEKLPVDEEPGNSCGENLTWELDTATGTLVISGTGTMDNSWWPYETPSESPNFAPWHDNAANIKSVVINSGVTSIGHFAFFDCVNLTNVSIPEGVTFIGCAFVGCDSLEELYIPASVTDFRYPSNEGVCTGLTKIVVDVSNSVYSSDEAGMLYNKDKTKFIGCPTGYQGAYTIADSVIEIGDWAFYACTSLTSVDVPTSVTTIGISAFNSCAKLDGIVIPDGVTTIGMFTFAYCAGLTEITIPKNVTALGNGVFTECTALAEVRFEGDAPDIDYECFNQTSTTAYYPAGNSTWTEDKLSNYCGNIQWVEYADNVNQCGDELFWEFDADTKTLTISGKGEMYDFPDAGSPWYSLNAEIDHVVISEGATSIGNYAFVSCGVDDIEIPDSVTRIGQGAFALSSIESIKIPSGVTTIEEYTFTRSSLNSVVLPEQLKVIEENAFAETPLTTVTLPETLTEIGAEAFWSTMLTSVTIPKNVSVMGAGAFAWCEELTSISVAADNANFAAKSGVLFDKDGTTLIQYPAKKDQATYAVPTGTSVIGAYAFSGAKALKKVELTGNLNSLKKCAFIGCSGLTEMNIPENVSSFGLGLFDNCRDLKNLIFTGDAPVFAEHWISEDMNLTAYYPADSETWTDEVKQNYGGKITWVVSCDHSFGDWYETKAPTEEVEGEERRDCENCGHYELRPIDKLSDEELNKCGDKLFWKLDENGTLTITGTGPMYDFYGSVPSSPWNDNKDSILKVVIENGATSIGACAFWGCTKLISVSVPETVKSIGNTAFSECYSLTTVNIPNDITTIGAYTFEACLKLESITIPKSVNSIETFAFLGCGKLTEITFEHESTDQLTITDRAFDKNVGISVDTIIRISDIEHICEGLTAYRWASSHRIVTYSDGTDSISYCGDYLTWELTETGMLIIDGYGDMADFDYNFDSNVPWEDFKNQITCATLTNDITSISAYAFENCANLTKINLPDGITSIGNRAFYNCGLTNVDLPDSLTFIAEELFYRSHKLESVEVPEDIQTIGDSAFEECYKLKSINIPNKVTYIGRYAFSSCYELNNITLPEGLDKIRDSTFSDCRCLNSIVIPSTVEEICYYAFSDCYKLEKVIITNGVKSIGTNAFQDCTSLEEVTIPGSITSIACENVFTGCSSLREINVDASNAVYSSIDGILYNKIQTELLRCPSAKEKCIRIPDGVVTIGANAFNSCNMLDYVIVPDSVKTILSGAFSLCSRLKDVYYAGSEEMWTSITGSSNLQNVTIHYNSFGPVPNGTVLYFREWKDTEKTACFGQQDPNEEFATISYRATDETDMSFLENVDSLLNTYVLVESKPSETLVFVEELISIRPVETKLGVVSSADENTIVIDGKTYATPVDLMSPDSYIGKQVRYFLYEGVFVTLEILEITSGQDIRYLSNWDAGNRTVTFGRDIMSMATVPENADPSLLNALDSLLGNYVLVEIKEQDGVGELVSILPVESIAAKVEYVSSTFARITIGGTEYPVSSGDLVSNVKVDDYALCHIYDGEVIAVEILQKLTGKLMGWNIETREVSITPDDDSELVSLAYLLSELADADTLELLNTLSSGSTTIATPILLMCDTQGLVYRVSNRKCGDNLTWTLDTEGTLTISGTGDMYDFEQFCIDDTWFTDAPWYEYRNQITSAEVEDGVSYIGSCAFSDLINMTEISFPQTLEEINANAFDSANVVKAVYFSGDVEQWSTLRTNVLRTVGKAAIFYNGYQFDVWGFDNMYNSSGNKEDGYYMSWNDYSRLTHNLSNSDVAAVRYVYENKLFESLGLTSGVRFNIDGNSTDAIPFSGFCYGYNIWVFLQANRIVTSSSISGAKYNLLSNSLTKNVESAINFYYAQQFLSAVQQEKENFMKLDQKEQLAQLKEYASKGTPFLINYAMTLYEVSEDDTHVFGDKITTGSHSVIGYGLEVLDEPKEITINGKTREYTYRVLILDCSDLGQKNEVVSYKDNGQPAEGYDKNLYFNDDGKWCIPGRYIVSEDNDQNGKNNNAQLELVTGDSSILNAVSYTTGKYSSIVQTASASGTKSAMLSTSSEVDYTLLWDSKSADISGFYVSSEYENDIVVSIAASSAFSGGDYGSTATAFLPGGVESYTVTSDETMSFVFRNDNYHTGVATTSAGSLTFTQNGMASICTDEASDFYIDIIANEGYYDLPWYKVEITGENVTEISTEKTSDGILVYCDNMDTITIAVTDNDGTTEITTGSGQDVILISEQDGELVVLEDSDGDDFYETDITAANVHVHSYAFQAISPTCTEQGYTVYTCAACGDSYTDDYTNALGHDYNSIVTAPTETEMGYTTHTCSRCGDSYVDSYTDPTGHKHSWNNGVVTREATCTKAGEKTYTCTSCGKTKVETIKALGHNYNSVVTAPTSTTKGYTTHTCSRCDDSYVDSYVAVTGHTCTAGNKWYSNGTYHWYLCTSCGAWVKTSYHSYSSDTDESCNVCGYTRTVTATEPAQETEVAMTETTETISHGEEVIATETAPTIVSTETNENLSYNAVSEDTDSHGVSSVLITVFAIVALGSLAALAILLVYKKRRKSE